MILERLLIWKCYGTNFEHRYTYSINNNFYKTMLIIIILGWQRIDA